MPSAYCVVGVLVEGRGVSNTEAPVIPRCPAGGGPSLRDDSPSTLCGPTRGRFLFGPRMSTQGYSSSPSRNATKSPKVSVSSKGNGKVAGNQTGPTNTATGHAPGSSVKGFSGQGTKGGKIKV